MAITKITGASIAADSIDGTKIADDAVNSEHLTDGGIDDVHIGDVAATKLTGTIASGRLSAANLGSGTVPTARLGSGTANSGVFLRGDNTWATAGSTSASDLASGTLPMARLSGTLPALNASALTAIPAANITGTLPAISGANLTGIEGVLAGLILPFANTSVPTGFLACDGAAVSRSTYATLFTAIASVWGSGDGSSTFNVPDLRGAFLRGTGSHGSVAMAKGTGFAGAAVGAFENDQSQDHQHYVYTQGKGLGWSDLGANSNYRQVQYVRSHDFGIWLETDGPRVYNSQGTPRVGDETRPFNAGILYCIKY